MLLLDQLIFSLKYYVQNLGSSSRVQIVFSAAGIKASLPTLNKSLKSSSWSMELGR